MELMLEAPWMKSGDKSTPASRKPYLEEVARNINLLDLEQAQQLREDAVRMVYEGHALDLALSIAAIGMLPKTNEAGFDGQQYLLHSLATAAIAKQLALRLIDNKDRYLQTRKASHPNQ